MGRVATKNIFEYDPIKFNIKRQFDGTIKDPKVFLLTRTLKKLGQIYPIEDFYVLPQFTEISECSFTVYKYNNGVQLPLFDRIKDLSVILVEGFGLFQLKITTTDTDVTCKKVTGTALQHAELGQILGTWEINTTDGDWNLQADADTSTPNVPNQYKEYRATVFYRDTYDIDQEIEEAKKAGETELVKELTKEREFMVGSSLLNRVLSYAPTYTIGHVDESLCSIQREFSASKTTVDSFLSTIADEVGCIFIYDPYSRTLNAFDATTHCTNFWHFLTFYDETTGEIDYDNRDTRHVVNGVCQCCKDKTYTYVDEHGETKTITFKGTEYIEEGFGVDVATYMDTTNLAESIEDQVDADSIKNCFTVEGGDDTITNQVGQRLIGGENKIITFSDDQLEEFSDELREKWSEYNEYVSSRQTEFNEAWDNYNEAVSKIAYYEHSMMPVVEITSADSISADGTDPKEQCEDLFKKIQKQIEYTYITTPTTGSTTVANTVLSFAQLLLPQGYKIKYMTRIEDEQIVDDWKVEKGSDTYSGKTYEVIVKFSCKMYLYIPNATDEDGNDLYYYATPDYWTMDVIKGYKETTDEDDTIYTNDYYKYLKQKMAYVEAKSEQTYLPKYDTDYDDDPSSHYQDADYYTNFFDEYNITSLQSYRDAYAKAGETLRTQSESLSDADKILQKYIDDDGNVSDKTLYDVMIEKYNAFVSYCDTRIEYLNGIVEAWTTKKDAATATITEINDKCNLKNYLGDDLYYELCTFLREDTYTNSNFTSDSTDTDDVIWTDTIEELILDARIQIAKACQSQHSISLTIGNILSALEYDNIATYFALGNYVRTRINGKLVKMRVVGIKFDYSAIESTEVTFSDTMVEYNGLTQAREKLDQAASISTSFQSVEQQTTKNDNNIEQVNELLMGGVDATELMLMNSDNQTTVIDEYGLLSRRYNDQEGTYDDCQLRITNNNLLVSDDNWKTIKAAIGKIAYVDPDTKLTTMAYGVRGDVLVGKLLMGETLKIIGKNNSVTIDDNGITLDGGNITWTSKVKQSAIDGLTEDLKEFTNEIGDLQKQIDGEIDTWFYNGTPGADKPPENSWTTDEEKIKHEGDVYYDNETGYAYRYSYSDEEKKHVWVEITDSAVIEALKKAQTAQDTADCKRRTFCIKPTTPYDVGDLWILDVENASGEDTNYPKYAKGTLLASTVDRAKTDVYTASDWIESVKYSELIENVDTKVNTAAVSTIYMYQQNDSQTTPPEPYPASGWSTDVPKWEDKKYIWQMSVITKVNGKQEYSSPVCISGGQGDKGINGLSMILSNESVSISCDAEGTSSSCVLDNAYTEVSVIEGITDVTSSWTISVDTSFGCEYTLKDNVCTITKMSSDYDYAFITLKAVRTGYSTLYKTFTANKTPNGNDASMVQVQPDYLAVGLDKNGNYKPTTLTIDVLRIKGTDKSEEAHTVGYTIDDSSKVNYFSDKKSEYALTLSSLSTKPTKRLKFFVYDDDGNELDAQGVVVNNDGYDGNPSVTMNLSNEAQIIPSEPDGTSPVLTDAKTNITINRGGTDDTLNWKCSVASSTGSTFSIVNNYQCVLSAIDDNVDTAIGTITAKRTGYDDLVREFTVTKGKKGKDAEYVTLVMDSNGININKNGSYSPTTVKATAYLRKGNTSTLYPCKMAYIPDGDSSKIVQQTTQGEWTVTLSNAAPTSTLSFYVYDTSGNIADSETLYVSHDGTDGDSAYVMTLSNDSQPVPSEPDGSSPVLTDAYTKYTIYEGGKDTTSSFTIGKTDSGCVSTLDTSKQLVTVTSMTSDTATVTISASKSGVDPISRVFSLTKQKKGTSGENAVYYVLTTSYSAVNLAEDGTYSPSKITATVTQVNGNTRTAYPCTIGYAIDDGSETTVSTQGTYTLDISTLTTKPKKNITFYAYKVESGSLTLLDSQGVVITSDGKKGADGTSVANVTNYYLAYNSYTGVTKKTPGWTTTVQSVSKDNQFLWNYEVVKDDDGNTISETDPGVIGTYGNGIDTITEYYQVSTSGTTAPTGTWSTTPVTMDVTNKYLWNYETIKYVDGSTKDTSKRVIGVYGDTGKQGDKGDKGDQGDKGDEGDDGVSITNVVTQYYLSTSNTKQEGGSWEYTQPSWQSNHYYWIRSEITYSNSKTSYTDPALAVGLNNANTELDTFRTDICSALALDETKIGVDSIISPKIGGGYLNITTEDTNGYEVEIDPQSIRTGSTIFDVRKKNGSTYEHLLQVTNEGKLIVKGDIQSGSTITGSTISGGTVTGTTISGATVKGTTVRGGALLLPDDDSITIDAAKKHTVDANTSYTYIDEDQVFTQGSSTIDGNTAKGQAYLSNGLLSVSFIQSAGSNNENLYHSLGRTIKRYDGTIVEDIFTGVKGAAEGANYYKYGVDTNSSAKVTLGDSANASTTIEGGTVTLNHTTAASIASGSTDAVNGGDVYSFLNGYRIVGIETWTITTASTDYKGIHSASATLSMPQDVTGIILIAKDAGQYGKVTSMSYAYNSTSKAYTVTAYALNEAMDQAAHTITVHGYAIGYKKS